jgi:cell wall-associated NlpC family hydrolase
VRCAVPVASVRAEPDDAAEQVTQLLAAEPVAVSESRGDWVRILTAYGYPGWVRVEALEEGDGELAVSFGDPVAAARSYLGAPYEWGGMTAAGIDCSGLVHIAYRAVGRFVPRDAWQQEAAGEPVPWQLTRPGDREARILHSTGRDRLGVVEEDEPVELATMRRGAFRYRSIGLKDC